MGRAALVGSAIVLLASSVDSFGADLTYQSQSRQVEALIAYPGDSASEFQQALGWGPFAGAVAVEYFSPTGTGTAGATQQSQFGPKGFGVTGSTAIANPFFSAEVALYQARSIFDVTFLLDAATPFLLEAAFAGTWDVGGTNINGGEFSILLEGPGGVLLADAVASPGPSVGGAYDPPISHSLSGNLIAGTYHLRVEFVDELWAYGSVDDPPGSFGFGGGGESLFSLTLVVPEPATSVVLLVVALPRRAVRR